MPKCEARHLSTRRIPSHTRVATAPSRIRKCFGNHRATKRVVSVLHGRGELKKSKSLVLKGLWKLGPAFVTTRSCSETVLKLLMGEQLWQTHQARPVGEASFPALSHNSLQTDSRMPIIRPDRFLKAYVPLNRLLE